MTGCPLQAVHDLVGGKVRAKGTEQVDMIGPDHEFYHFAVKVSHNLGNEFHQSIPHLTR